MVLQAGKVVPIWGEAAPGEHVIVSFAGQRVTAVAAADGRWKANLARLTPSVTPAELTVEGNNVVRVQDVLVGEVWLGSGQSNMALRVQDAQNFPAEQAAAKFPTLRLFKEESRSSPQVQTHGLGRWVVCSPGTVAPFSAVLYFFGREIQSSLGGAVGLINSSEGATPIESWIDASVQRAEPGLKDYVAKLEADPAEVARRHGDLGGLFNAKIAPLVPFGVRGVLWYQGEANTFPEKAPFYERELRLLIKDWRAKWGEALPFAWVQLPNFGGPGRNWPLVREAMLKALAEPGTGMAIAIDVGEEKNIHPKNKQAVGHRLALWALGSVYERKMAATSGPLPRDPEFRGHQVVVPFSHTAGGLVAQGGPLRGFDVAGEDRKWRPAEARVAGDAVEIEAAEVATPVAVRYAWENNPSCNLFNAAGLPATPFRTDTWD
jgi:sialate O-acetylesterase